MTKACLCNLLFQCDPLTITSAHNWLFRFVWWRGRTRHSQIHFHTHTGLFCEFCLHSAIFPPSLTLKPTPRRIDKPIWNGKKMFLWVMGHYIVAVVSCNPSIVASKAYRHDISSSSLWFSYLFSDLIHDTHVLRQSITFWLLQTLQTTWFLLR